MAQLRDLLVNGASRFLGVVNFNDEAIFNKGVTLNETLTLLKNTDANGGTYNSPALVIGDKDAGHLEFDGNEIMSKASETTTAQLHLNHDGGQVIIGPGGMSTTGVVTIGSGDAATSSTAGELIVDGGIAVSAASFFGDKITADTLTLTNTSMTSHIAFSRGNFNYITAPTSGVIAFVVNGQAVGDTSSEFIIKDGEIRPGTTNVTTLGASNYRWSTIYGINLNITGNATIGDAATDAHTIKGKVTLTGEFIPNSTATYSLGDATHYWKKLYVGDGTDSSSTTTGSVIVDGGVGISKSLVVGDKINLIRKNGNNYGRISFYDPSYYTWFEYMSNAVEGAAPTTGKPATYGDVTNWARRSLIESSAGYGWIWESATNAKASAATTAVGAVMALSSNTGNLRIKGDFVAEGGDVTLGSAGTYYINTGTSKLNALTTVGVITAGSNVVPDATQANELGSSTLKWKNLYVGNGTAASAVNTGNVQIDGGLSASQNSYFDAQVIVRKAVMEYDDTDECLYFSFNV